MLAGIEAIDQAESGLRRQRRPGDRHTQMAGKTQCRRNQVLDRLFEWLCHARAWDAVDDLRHRSTRRTIELGWRCVPWWSRRRFHVAAGSAIIASQLTGRMT